MIPTRHVIGVVGLALAHTAITQAHYCIKDSFVGYGFIDTWNWETFDDPTHGRVNYIDKEAAFLSNLSFASANKFIIRADSSKIVSPNDRGRDSIRITSNAAYEDSVVVVDLTHMPEGCGTWPAFWTLSKTGPWPNGGEIDIVEGVNLNTQNLASLHTKRGCCMKEPRLQNGKTVSSDCDTSVNFNQGCGTSFSKSNSYGAGLNAVGGGWYIMERSKTRGINIWFWSRNDPSVPFVVSQGLSPVVPDDTWGIPEAHFSPDSCNHDAFFNAAHQLIINLTFCGDWAGSAFGTSGCGPHTCNDFVNNNPEVFAGAYWEINSLRVYTLEVSGTC